MKSTKKESAEIAVEVSNLVRIYGKGDNQHKALDNVRFKIEEGASVAIIGKSGSGKSTLMHAVAGLDRPTSGTVEVKGRNIWNLSPPELNKFRNCQIGFIFQTFYMQPSETVLKNVMLPSEIAGVSHSQRKKNAMHALEQLDMTDKAQNRAMDLSGGQKQRVCIARAISTQPDILFADEPTGNLDSTTGARVEKILLGLNEKLGSTLMVVTHDDELASRLGARIHIKDGFIERIDGKGVTQ